MASDWASLVGRGLAAVPSASRGGKGSVSEAGSTIKEIAAEQIREAGKEKKEAEGPASGRDTRNHRDLSAGAGRNHHRVRRLPGREVGRPERPVVRDVVATPDSGSAARDLGGQLRLYDAITFNDWLTAEQMGNQDLARRFEARFRPAFRVAFDAWMKTDPFNNPRALPGPMFMPEYHVSSSEQGAKESLKRNRY
jgi:hypothetical protein